MLVTSLDYTATLEQVAQFVVPTLADYCAVTLMTANGTFRKTAITHVDPSKQERLQDLYMCVAPDTLSILHPVFTVLRTGQAVLYEDLDGDSVISAHDADYLKTHRDLEALK